MSSAVVFNERAAGFGGLWEDRRVFVRASCRVDYWLSSAMELHVEVHGDYGDLESVTNNMQLMCPNHLQHLKNWVFFF